MPHAGVLRELCSYSLRPMPSAEALVLIQAAGLGLLHALIPCAHSWPMLVPFLAHGQRATRVALSFGTGITLAAAALGACLSGLMPTMPEAWLHRAEEATGLVLIIIAGVLLWRTRAAHLGHVHGDCEREDDHGCGHRTHKTQRFAKLGPTAALVALGFFNAVVPCWTSVAAIALAAPSEGRYGALGVLLAFALSATLGMWIVLAVAARGFGVLDRLRSPGVEAWVLRGSGVLLLFSGASLLLHWHEHG